MTTSKVPLNETELKEKVILEHRNFFKKKNIERTQKISFGTQRYRCSEASRINSSQGHKMPTQHPPPISARWHHHPSSKNATFPDDKSPWEDMDHCISGGYTYSAKKSSYP